MKNIIIAGCGYTGERLARRYAASGDKVTAIVRSVEKRTNLSAAGCDEALITNFDAADSMPHIDISGASLFYMVPPIGGGSVDSRCRNFITSISKHQPPAKIIYLSATSVYSEVVGGVVNERSETLPNTAMGKRRLDAEAAFTEYGKSSGAAVIILRVSAIYGPGRLPLMQLSQAQPVLNESEAGMSNRIHIDDLVEVCIKAEEFGVDGDIFNVSDGSPSSMTAYFNLCADTLGMPRPPQVSRSEAHNIMSPLMLAYSLDSRIVDSSAISHRLNFKPIYTDMYSGVPASR